MGELSDFEVGQTVELQDGRIAVVRYIGNPHFAAGYWIGVSLEDASGKNDGSVQGQRYFDCEPGHGMFVRPGVATVIEQPTPRPLKKPVGDANGGIAKSRQSVAGVGALRRQSVLDSAANKRQSISRGSPTPSSRSAASSQLLRSPSKSPTKQLSSGLATGNNVRPAQALTLLKQSSGPAKAPTGKPSRLSIGPLSSTTSRAPRLSMLGPMNGSAKTTAPSAYRPANRLSTLQQGPSRSSSLSLSSQNSAGSNHRSSSDDPGLLSPSSSDVQGQRSRSGLNPALSRTSVMSKGIASPSISSPRSVASSGVAQALSGQAPLSNTAVTKEVEDLKAKLRVMEKKRLEDREKIKKLDKIQGERDRFEVIIQKLQSKYQPQQQEISDLRRQIKEAESKLETSENQQVDIDAAIEMATLDREMAEETAEAVKSELEALRVKYEELELEVEILREENAELGKEMTPEEKTSQGWIQMERNNDRLRAALLRLRDMTQEQEAALKQQIKELESDVQELEEVRASYQEVKEKLAQSDATVDNLRQQLETALGAEEMIEELTDKNFFLTEKMDELKAAIEDLENLKELNDELEINHIETEKQMQSEIDYLEILLQDQIRKSSTQEETIGDLEYTISRFRDLVTTLQGDLEDMRASQQITEIEANELSSRSRAMLDLNRRLQVSATKAQVKAIDIELGKMQAEESAEHLAIVRLFLPETFTTERESVNALLRFKRIGFKASLLCGLVKERMNNPSIPGREENIFACLDVLDKLTWISTICERFTQFIYTSSLESFERLGSALYDLDPVERALNSWIDGLKRDELKEQQCAAELQRSISLMTHLAELHIPDGLHQFADEINMRATLMQSNLDNAAWALSSVKATVVENFIESKEETAQDEEEDEALQSLLRKMDSLVSQIRSAKVIATKGIHQLKELKSRSLTLEPSTLPVVEQSQNSTQELVSSCCLTGLSLWKLLNDETRKDALTAEELLSALTSSETSPFTTLLSKTNVAASQMQSFYNLTTTLSQTVEFSTSGVRPWEIISQKVRAVSSTLASYEKEVGRLKDELAEKHTALAIKDKILEELSVNVEVLEKRVGESGGRREKLRELEGNLDSSRSREREMAKKLVALEHDLRSLEAERESWKRQILRARAQAGSRDALEADDDLAQYDSFSPRAQEDIVRLKAEIASLQSTIRYLRLSNHETYNKSAYSFLETPLVPSPKPLNYADLAREARDVLKSMMTLVTQPESQLVKLERLEKQARLGWRPARQTSRWQIGRQREDWEAWREWRDDVRTKTREWSGEANGKVGRAEKKPREILARVGFRFHDLDGKAPINGQEVMVADPHEWEALETSLGIL